jgi:cell division protein FtsN
MKELEKNKVIILAATVILAIALLVVYLIYFQADDAADPINDNPTTEQPDVRIEPIEDNSNDTPPPPVDNDNPDVDEEKKYNNTEGVDAKFENS